MSAQVLNENKKLVHCYNKGCGKLFDLEDNKPDACQYHPGVPVFHDALKGWSCCNKKSTDFTQFLSIPGCAKSNHSNEKPPEAEKPPVKETLSNDTNKVEIHEIKKAPEPTPRPTNNAPLIELKRTISASLTTALDKLKNETSNESKKDDTSGVVPVGTPCKNATCQAKYENENSNNEKCIHHSGVAIFHEGMKYWSCCQRKTSDFDNFLNQVGCTESNHVWFKKESVGENVDCRYDFHQTGGFVILTIYSKNPLPDKTTIKANTIKLDINLSFEAGQKSFIKLIDLYGVINLEDSVVNFYQPKVEIKLKKADAISWPKLEFTPPKAN